MDEIIKKAINGEGDDGVAKKATLDLHQRCERIASQYMKAIDEQILRQILEENGQ